MKILNQEYERYFRWLCDKVCFGRNNGYGKLALKLFDTDFIYIIRNDENREADGLYLRYTYSIETGLPDKPNFLDGCSVLEMLLSLANRINYQCYDENIGDQPEKWFAIMLDNVGLLQFDDLHYDDIAVDRILRMVMYREYTPSCLGGFFPLKFTNVNMKDQELCVQMQYYLAENNYILPKSLDYLYK